MLGFGHSPHLLSEFPANSHGWITGYHWCYLRNLLWLRHYVAAMSQWHEYDHIMGVLLLYALRSLVRFPIRLESNQKASNLASTVPGNQKNNVWKLCCNYLQTDLSGSKANPNFKSTLNHNSLEETLTTLQINQKRTWWELLQVAVSESSILRVHTVHLPLIFLEQFQTHQTAPLFPCSKQHFPPKPSFPQLFLWRPSISRL